MGSSPSAHSDRFGGAARLGWRGVAFGAALATWFGLQACSGAQSGGASPPPSEGEAETGDEVAPSGSEEAARPADRCADGSCFACGEGLCPPGFYCDLGAVGGPACSWAPACPREPSCGCVERELGGSCRCEARGGGLYVSCS